MLMPIWRHQIDIKEFAISNYPTKAMDSRSVVNCCDGLQIHYLAELK